MTVFRLAERHVGKITRRSRKGAAAGFEKDQFPGLQAH
jgi:hypothetical protein